MVKVLDADGVCVLGCRDRFEDIEKAMSYRWWGKYVKYPITVVHQSTGEFLYTVEHKRDYV